MDMNLTDQIAHIQEGLIYLLSEGILTGAVLAIITLGLFKNRFGPSFFRVLTALTAILSGGATLWFFPIGEEGTGLFFGMLHHQAWASYFKVLFDLGLLFTVGLSKRHNTKKFTSEYYALVLALVLGCHFLVMSTHLLMVFLSIELISISSYVLSGFAFHRQGAEGSLKYFLYGAVASAFMLYGISLLYGLAGTVQFTSDVFFNALREQDTLLVTGAALMVLLGFLFKIAGAPMHAWAPDVYEAAPIPVTALLSVVPKLAGIGIMGKFVWLLHGQAQGHMPWAVVLSAFSILSLTVGNFSALWASNPRRMMAYSSIAQAGFLLAGLVPLTVTSFHFALFYSTVYLVMNYLAFAYIAFFESQGIVSFQEYSGKGYSYFWPAFILLIALVSLTGLPPTGGFMGKVFVFSALWEGYLGSGEKMLLALFVLGLLNTVVSLFYYLRIPFYSFLKEGKNKDRGKAPFLHHFWGLLACAVLLALFFRPGWLMGWINKINFVFN